MIEEIFLQIKSYPNYAISTYGRVLDLKTLKVMKQQTNHAGYPRIGLTNEQGMKRFSVHRLVLATFSPTKGMEKLECNHIDAIRSNNKLENLEWVTRKQNAEHTSKMGNTLQGEKSPLAKLTEDQVRYILASKKTQVTLAHELGVTQPAISLIRLRKNWSHI